MPARRVGLWMIGAFGGVGTTIALGLAAIAKGRAGTVGLVTARPPFDGLDLPGPGQFVIGGHEVRRTSFAAAAEEFRRNSGALDSETIAACREELDAASGRVRPGVLLKAGETIERMGDWSVPVPSPRAAIDQIASDLQEFVRDNAIDHLIVLNVASTEPPFPANEAHLDWDALSFAIESGRLDVLPPSSLYAIAALRHGHTYINFTPSFGASCPAIHQLADLHGALHAGKDGKTGETLLKTVLAPMFLARNLEVMSWVGHNIFGNRDGAVLDDPVNKASKVGTKDQVVYGTLGYKPKTLVTIEYVPDMGDWKTAWDHIHFKGFLNVPMTMQFTWQGCDSLLAAPLAIDLARLADLEKRSGATGLMRHLASFFKGPEGVTEHDFFKQLAMLHARAEELKGPKTRAS